MSVPALESLHPAHVSISLLLQRTFPNLSSYSLENSIPLLTELCCHPTEVQTYDQNFSFPSVNWASLRTELGSHDQNCIPVVLQNKSPLLNLKRKTAELPHAANGKLGQCVVAQSVDWLLWTVGSSQRMSGIFGNQRVPQWPDCRVVGDQAQFHGGI